MATFLKQGAVAVDGLNETIRGLKKLDKRFPSEVRKALKARTERVVLPDAQQNWRQQPIKPHVASAAVKPIAGQAQAGIRTKYNDARFPYGAGVVFGSLKFRQFKSWKGNQHTGNTTFDDYVVTPAWEKNADRFAAGAMDDIIDAIDRAVQ